MNKAVESSSIVMPGKYDPIPVNQRARNPEVPCGLLNIGNTCYFSCLAQILFFLPNI